RTFYCPTKINISFIVYNVKTIFRLQTTLQKLFIQPFEFNQVVLHFQLKYLFCPIFFSNCTV
uniref:Uncharacterized protein n=1 Tax=Ciona intestinalis TaxID=7719 RepID=H2Y273_CIOIN